MTETAPLTDDEVRWRVAAIAHKTPGYSDAQIRGFQERAVVDPRARERLEQHGLTIDRLFSE